MPSIPPQLRSDPAPPRIPPGRFWAKWDETSGLWHPLSAHSADVAAVMATLLTPGSPLAARLAGTLGEAELHPAHRAALVYLTALHDMGKVNHGFQTKNRPHGARGEWRSRGHVKVLVGSMDLPGVESVIHDALSVIPADEDDARDLFRSVVCHHGRPWNDDGDDITLSGLWRADAERDPRGGMRELIACARRWSGIEMFPDTPPLRPTAEFTHFLAGAVMLADWIGSTETIFPLNPEADADPDGYWRTALERAGPACRGIGIVPGPLPSLPEAESLLQRLFPNVFGPDARVPATPTVLQRCAATMELPPPGSRLLIESETGSGKTEAVLALYARLRAAGRVGGLMFALPTRATASAMHERVCAAVRALYPADAQPSIALAVGGVQPVVTINREELADAPDRDPDEETADLSSWASENAKRYLAAEIVVGTLDQVLLAGLAVRHAHLRLAALSRHLLVVDELHSYDRYMATVLDTLLRPFTAAGGIAAFISATLSDTERRRVGGADSAETTLEEASARAYPLLSVRTPRDPDWQSLPLRDAVPPPAKRVRWEAIGGDEAAAVALLAASRGARVCVIRNTVTGARSLHASIAKLDTQALLWRPSSRSSAPPYHSRYTLPDRLALDGAVLARFGKSAPARHGSGTILVATQVVEQSLDVDFDLLITDLCPTDVLLQRIGRLHRHPERSAERPPEHRDPRCLILCPPDGVEQYRKGKGRGPNGWGTVYPDLGDLHLTLALIRARSDIEIPAQNRELIEAVYHPLHRESLMNGDDQEWREYLERMYGVESGREYQARSVSLVFQEPYPENAIRYRDDSVRDIRTRLGDDTVRIRLSHSVRCWYAPQDQAPSWADLPIRNVTAEGYALLTRTPEAEIPAETNANGETQFRLGGRIYRYTPSGWDWEDE